MASDFCPRSNDFQEKSVTLASWIGQKSRNNQFFWKKVAYFAKNISILKAVLSLKYLLTISPFFALDIFICSFRKCIQHTTRGQSNFPLSKLCCCYIFIVLKYWWQNSITAHIYANCDQGLVTRWVKKVQKEGKWSSEGFRGSYFCFTDQSMAALVWLRAAMLSSVPGVEIHLHTSHSILLLPVWYLRSRIEWALQSTNGRGNRILNSIWAWYSQITLRPNSFIVMYLNLFE